MKKMRVTVEFECGEKYCGWCVFLKGRWCYYVEHTLDSDQPGSYLRCPECLATAEEVKDENAGDGDV